MKIRLIIASFSTFVIAILLATTMRTSAVAQQDPPPTDEQLTEASEENTAADEEAESEPADELQTDDAEVLADEDAEALANEDAESDDAPALEGEEIVSDAEEASTEADESEELTFDFTAAESEDEVAVRHEASETLSVDFPDEEIRSVLRIVADLFDLNLVVPEELVGRASIKLRDVTWRQVFDVVLSPVGFTYVEDGNIIKIVSLESLTLEPPVTVVVILDYAQADGILPSIQPLVNAPTGGRVQIDKRSNALVITERPTQLRRIENIISALDKPNVQVMIESKFIETRNLDIDNIGVNWASLQGWGASAGPFTHEFLRERNVVSNQTTDGSQADTSRITTAVFSADEFGFILSALKTNNQVKLVSNPTVVTLNNRPARIHIGEEFPIVLPRFNPQTGTYEAGEYDTIDIGIKLDVTPQVNNAGFINLEVEPDVSTLSGTVNYFGAQYPVRATRNAKSHVTIKDGFTLAIGGLVQEDTTNVQRKVPLLGSIPGVGRLFRSDNKDNDSRNLIIFLTARSLSPDGTTVEETVDPRTIRKMDISREDVPGYRPDMPVWPKTPEEIAEEEAQAQLEAEEAAAAAEAEAAEAEAEAGLEAEAESTADTEEAVDAESDTDVELIQTGLTDSEEATEEESAAVSEEDASSDEAEAGEDAEADSEEATDEETADSEAATEESEEVAATEAEEATEADEAVETAQPERKRRSSWITP